MPGDLRRPPRGTTCGRTCAPAGVRTPPRPFAANRDSLRRVAGYVCNYFGQPGGSNLGNACAESYAEGFEGAPDGSDFPGNTPGGHSRYCSNMAYDIDGDGLAEIIRCDNAQYVKYISGTDYQAYPNSNRGSWKTAHIESLGTHFADAFGQGCTAKDCTHGNLYDCVTGVGTGCKDIFGGVAIQCYCSKEPHNCPPFPTTRRAPRRAAAMAAGWPIACDALVENTGLCGPNHGNAMCRYCCSSTGFCGDDDGTGIYCGEGAIRGSSYKLIDPERVTCPWKPDPVEFDPEYCTVNPMNNKQYCVRLPAGKSMADPVVVRGLEKLFKDDYDHLFDKPPPPPPKPPVEQGRPWVQSTLPFPNRGGAAVAMDPTIALRAG